MIFQVREYNEKEKSCQYAMVFPTDHFESAKFLFVLDIRMAVPYIHKPQGTFLYQ